MPGPEPSTRPGPEPATPPASTADAGAPGWLREIRALELFGELRSETASFKASADELLRGAQAAFAERMS